MADRVEYVVTRQGVPFRYEASSQEEAEAQADVDLENEPELVATQAHRKGLRYDWATGQAREYTGIEKAAIGAGREATKALRGLAQLAAGGSVGLGVGDRKDFHKGQSAAEYLERSKREEADEREFYEALDKQAVGAEDLGQIAALAPLFMYAGGVASLAGRGALEGGIGAVAGDDESRVSNAASGAALSAAGGAPVKSLGVLMRSSKVATMVGAAVLDMMATGGFASGSLAGKAIASSARHLKSASKKRLKEGYDGAKGVDYIETVANLVANGKDSVVNALLDSAKKIKNPGEMRVYAENLGARLGALAAGEVAE